MSRISRIALIVAPVLTVAGCSLNGTTAGTVSTSTSMVADTTSTLPGTPVGEIVVRRASKQEFCAVAKKADAGLDSVFSSDTRDDDETGWRTVEERLRMLLSAVPDDVIDEARVIAANAVSYLRVVQEHDWNMTALSADAEAVDRILLLTSDERVETASDVFDRYMKNKCKIAPDS